MRKSEKKSRKGQAKKSAGRSAGRDRRAAWPSLQETNSDAEGLTFTLPGIFIDILVRTGAGTAFLLKPVFCAYYRSQHGRKELDRMLKEQGAGADALVQVHRGLFADSVFAFAGDRALPDLQEHVRGTVLACFGQDARPGISIGGVFAWLEQNLPAQERRVLDVPDWEAIAGRIASSAMDAAPSGLADAYGKLRSLGGRYPGDPDYQRLFTPADSAACGLPAFVPLDARERHSFLVGEMSECWRLYERCMTSRQPFANWLHDEVEKTAWGLIAPLKPLFDQAFASQALWIREFFGWFMPEGDDDIDGMMAEFERRFRASGQSFDVFQTYFNCVSLMLRDWEALEWPHTDFFRLRAKNALKCVEALRVEPEGAW